MWLGEGQSRRPGKQCRFSFHLCCVILSTPLALSEPFLPYLRNRELTRLQVTCDNSAFFTAVSMAPSSMPGTQ